MSSNPDPIDVHVGYRVRLRRTLLGMSQEKLGAELGLTFQQIQKYERGANRIGSSRLYKLSKILDVSVSYFFEDMPNEVVLSTGFEEESETAFSDENIFTRETIELVRCYYQINNSATRKRVFELVKSVAFADDVQK